MSTQRRVAIVEPAAGTVRVAETVTAAMTTVSLFGLLPGWVVCD